MLEQLRTHSTLTLSGDGEVRAKPDLATVTLGVLTQGKYAQETMAQNAERMNKVIGCMKQIGIAADDMQTAGFNISPVYDDNDKSPTYRQIIGYQVADSLRVKSDVTRAGRVLDDGIAAGANVGGNLAFGLRDERPYRDRALQLAVEAARHNAEIVARAAGVTLKGMQSIDISYGGAPMIERSMMAKAAGTPIEAGTISITASVRIVFMV